MTEGIKYSLVIPVFNSSQWIHELVERCVNTLKSTGEKFEIILIDDCSQDESWENLKALKTNHEELTIIRLSKNFGQFAATYCGVENAQGSIVITIDDDLQYPPEEISNLLSYFENENNTELLVYGVPKNKKRTPITKFYALIMQLFVYLTVFRFYLPRGFYYTGFRIFNKEKLWSNDLNGNANHFDIYALWHLDPKFIGFTYVNHQKREKGKSGQTFRKKSSDAILNILCTFRSPLHLMSILAIILLFGSLLFFALDFCPVDFNLSKEIFTGIILFFMSITSFCLFVIGVYLSRLFSLKRGRKDYLVIEKIH